MSTYTKSYDNVQSYVLKGQEKTHVLDVDLTGYYPSGSAITSIVMKITPSSTANFAFSVNGTSCTRNEEATITLVNTAQQNVTLYANNRNTSGTSTTKYYYNFKNIMVTITYGDGAIAPGAPTNVALSANTAVETVTVSWTAPESTQANPVTGYTVQAADSDNGISWKAWNTIASLGATATSCTAAVNATVGKYRKYRVRTVGTDDTQTYSDWAESGMVKTIEEDTPFVQQPVTTMPPFRVAHVWRRVR